MQLQLWDTAGEEEYKAITSIYYRGANAALIVFDITRPETFENAKQWMEDVYLKCGSDVKITFIGNKCDLAQNMNTDHIEEFTDLHLSYWCLASAKDATNVDRIFRRTASDLIEMNSQMLSLPSCSNGPGSLFLSEDDLEQGKTGYCCSSYLPG